MSIWNPSLTGHPVSTWQFKAPGGSSTISNLGSWLFEDSLKTTDRRYLYRCQERTNNTDQCHSLAMLENRHDDASVALHKNFKELLPFSSLGQNILVSQSLGAMCVKSPIHKSQHLQVDQTESINIQRKLDGSFEDDSKAAQGKDVSHRLLLVLWSSWHVHVLVALA